MTTPLGWNSVQMDHSRGNTPERLLLHRCRALTLGFREPGHLSADSGENVRGIRLEGWSVSDSQPPTFSPLSVNLDTFQRIVEKMSAAESLTLTSPPVEFRVKKHPFVRRFRPRHRRSPHVPVDGPNRCGRRSPYDRNLCL